MSHVATVKVKLKDLTLLGEVCGELQVPCELGQAEVKLYSGGVKAAASFRLSGWNYPVAVLGDGTVQFDNYNGKWGATGELHRVLKRYSERITLRQAQRMGAAVQREERPDGSLVLRLRA
jgi:hypothetical protein